MITSVTTKVRAIGTSLGVILPRETLNARNIVEGEEIEVTIIRKKKPIDLTLINRAFGSARDAKIPFERDRRERI